jgi:hypothetical protein
MGVSTAPSTTPCPVTTRTGMVVGTAATTGYRGKSSRFELSALTAAKARRSSWS